MSHDLTLALQAFAAASAHEQHAMDNWNRAYEQREHAEKHALDLLNGNHDTRWTVELNGQPATVELTEFINLRKLSVKAPADSPRTPTSPGGPA